jgi:hypothetical protein
MTPTEIILSILVAGLIVFVWDTRKRLKTAYILIAKLANAGREMNDNHGEMITRILYEMGMMEVNDEPTKSEETTH